LKFLLINSNEANAFIAVYNEGELLITYSKELSEASLENRPRVKPPDKLIECLDSVVNKCKEKGIELSNIDAISVVTGPGSFTGIRVGLSIAKGFADALDKKIIPIDNFALTLNRLSSVDKDKSYCIIIPAKPPEYYFRIIKNLQEVETGFFFPDEIPSKINENMTLVGDFNDESHINLDYFSYINVKDLKSEIDSMIELSLRYYDENKARSPGEIEPLYIKDFVARKKNL
jgi:tRNA threonylcarbamoyladenosine biosynthesis protein TsaB